MLGRPDVYSSWALFSSHFTEEPMKLHSLVELHSYRARRSGAMPFGANRGVS